MKRFEVIVDPNRKEAYRGELLVGLGDSRKRSEGIVLQHKTEPRWYPSLSQWVYENDFSGIDREKCCHRIYLEDFSVDTVVALWLFFKKVSGEPLPENIKVWIDYANRWEQGDTSTTGEPFHSYGCLQNALASALRENGATETLSKSLAFLEELVRQGCDPAVIPSGLNDDLYRLAIASLQKEYARYESLIGESEVETLCLPTADEKRRRRVSAIFIETAMVTSIQKVFLRNDRDHAPTGDGFTLIALYKPAAAGTGNDIVISVDPAKGVQLRELWQALEREEDRLWEGKRPHKNPRPIASYPDGNGPDEPWWDDRGNYTLIASPKRVGNEYGRRVDWPTVKRLINECYGDGKSC